MKPPASKQPNLRSRYIGVLLGTAVGDALGLPAEGLSRERIHRRWKGEWRMRLLFGRGMVSDDTEHTLMVAQALLSTPHDAAAFQRVLGWKLRWWFICLPAGVGLATAKACLRLWIGFPANRAAVKSAGSGPAMRSAIIGARFATEQARRREFVLASSRLTHLGWQAEVAALAVAECVAMAVCASGQPKVSDLLPLLRSLSGEVEWQTLLSKVQAGMMHRDSVTVFMGSLGLEQGVTGYSLHVVPAAIYAWLRHPEDFHRALTSLLECGGDTDTAGAILGALMGASLGEEAIPNDWIKNIWEWPRSVGFMRELASRLALSQASFSSNPLRWFWPGILIRNIVFLFVVLAHGFRRLAPPY